MIDCPNCNEQTHELHTGRGDKPARYCPACDLIIPMRENTRVMEP